MKTYVEQVTRTGNPTDQLLAAMYYIGLNTSADTTNAISLLSKSVEQNNIYAAIALGNIYSARNWIDLKPYSEWIISDCNGTIVEIWHNSNFFLSSEPYSKYD